MPIEATWSAKLQRSISGFALIAVKDATYDWCHTNDVDCG